MARIRTIKPEFPQSETVGKLSRDARLLFIQLWTIADDAGRARAASRMLASLLYPYDDDVPSLIDGWLDELEAAECIRRYRVGTDKYLDIPNWLKHQKIDRPSPSRIPPFDEASRVIANNREPSTTDLGPGPRTKDMDLGPRTVDQAHEAPRAKDRAITPRDELLRVLDEQHADAVIEHRKAKRAKLTPHAANLLAAKFAKCRDGPNAAADAMISNGWQGFELDWYENRKPGNGNGQRKPSDLDNRRATADAIDEVVAMAEARQRGVGT